MTKFRHSLKVNLFIQNINNIIEINSSSLHIYEISDESKLFILHAQIVKEVNRIFSNYNLPLIHSDFLQKYHEKVFGKAPMFQNSWLSAFLGSRGDSKRVSPNNDTPASDYYACVRKSCQISAVPIRESQPFYRIPVLVLKCSVRIQKEGNRILIKINVFSFHCWDFQSFG